MKKPVKCSEAQREVIIALAEVDYSPEEISHFCRRLRVSARLAAAVITEYVLARRILEKGANRNRIYEIEDMSPGQIVKLAHKEK